MTYALMWIGSLALAGIGIPRVAVVGFAGFFSKDMIIEAAFAAHTGVGAFRLLAGHRRGLHDRLLFSWRLLFMTFHGEPRADEKT